ncbi:MAG: BCCT family transporter [Gordonia amarae]
MSSDQTEFLPRTKPQITKPQIDPIVFGVTAAFVIGFVIWGLVAPENMSDATSDALNWITDNAGWLYILTSSGFVTFALYLAFGKFSKIPLGKDGDEPEFRTVSWIAMMFSAGMGIGLMFFGSYEPLFHFSSPPPGTTAEDVKVAMATTMFHWGFHPWAMYAVVGLAIAYSTYRLGRTQLFSAVFAPLMGSQANGPGGKVIDILAIFATLFGTVASLGLGALQIGSGMTKSGWVDNPSTTLLVAIIAVLTACFVASAVSGVAKGIQWLSNTNMVLAIILSVFVFVVGPTLFILNLLPTSLGAYFNDITSMSARSSATTDADSWLAGWTIFYWAWWVSWTPFVGLFLAKISKGRTIREFVIGVMVVPSTVSLVWFAVFGGTAIRQFSTGTLKFDPNTAASEDTLFDVLDHLPLTGIASTLVMILVAIFFVSGADSASLVMGTLSERGSHHPSRTVTIFWGSLTGIVAAVLLAASGDDGLNGIKQMAIIAALPFVIVMVGMCLSLYLDLRKDPLIVARSHYLGKFDDHVRTSAAKFSKTGELGVVTVDPKTGLITPVDGAVPANGDGSPAAEPEGETTSI